MALKKFGKNLFGSAALAMAFAAQSGQAAVITLDFTNLPTGTISQPVQFQGFTLTPFGGFSSLPTIVDLGNGQKVLASSQSVFAGGADTGLTRTDGGTFSIKSIEVAAIGGDFSSWGVAVGSPGNGSGGGNIGWGNYLYGNPAITNWYPLPPMLTTFDVSAVAFLQHINQAVLNPISLYNFNVIGKIVVETDNTAVPEPGMIGLFGLGVLALAATVRRRRAA